MNNTKPNVLTIIINYNQWELTTACLASLSNVESIQNTVVVIDNGSTNNSIKELLQWNYGPLPSSITISKQLLPLIESRPEHCLQTINHTGQKTLPIGSYLIESKHNLGFSAGNNLAFDYINPSTFDYIWFLNNDTIVAPTAMTEKIKHFKSDASLGMVSATLYDYDEPNQIQLSSCNVNPFLGSTKNIIQYNTTIDYLCGASILIKSDCLNTIGIWDKRFFLNYEDADLSYRAKKAGFKLGVSKTAIVYHKASATYNSELAKGNEMIEISRLKAELSLQKSIIFQPLELF